jgi:CBS domain-containing protein
MLTVQQLLQNKGAQVWSIPPQATVYQALEIMADKDVGALLVMEGEQLVGIFSERDFARRGTLQNRLARETPVRDMMTPNVLYVRPDQTIEDCMALMTDKHIRHLPVLDRDRVAGVITIGDVVKAVISDQAFTIHELENYITGAGYGR